MNQENQSRMPHSPENQSAELPLTPIQTTTIAPMTSASMPTAGIPATIATLGHLTAATPIYPPPAAVPTASLYVGELSPEVNESMLFELFSQIGPVASIRVCRDALTRQSLGYAYVNFHSMLDGERAMDTLNYSLIKGQPCRIMWSQRDPSLRRSGQGNIFIKDLEKSIDNKALHDTFSAFGNILSCKVVTDENNESKGYGFVHFETQEAADLAIEKVNGMLLNDKKVFVGRHISKRERISKKEESRAQFTNIYIKNLDLSIGDEELRSIFEPYGQITSAVVVRDNDQLGGSLTLGDQQQDGSSTLGDDFQSTCQSTQYINTTNLQSKGFGFVNFAHHASAVAAVNEMNGAIIKGKELTVCRAQTKAERAEDLRRQFEAMRQERLAKYQGVNLYLKNMDESIDDEMLKNEFSPFGTIVSCKVMRDEKEISKGFGFVCFSAPEEAIKAQAEMNGKLIAGKPIFVVMAQRKEERKVALENQFSQKLGYLRAGLPPHTMPPHPGHQMVPGLFYQPHPAMMHHPNHRLPYSMPQQMLYSSSARRFSTRPTNAMTAGLDRSITGPSAGSGSNLNLQNVPFKQPFSQGNPLSASTSQEMGFSQTQQPFRHSYRTRAGGNGGAGGGRVSPPLSTRKGGNLGSPSSSNPGAATTTNSYRRIGGNKPFRNKYNNHHQQASNYNSPSFGGNEYTSPGSNSQYQQPSSSALVHALANASPQTQKSMIGELLYPIVEHREPALAAKITGMLLDMDNSDLLHLLESPDLLTSKIIQASELLFSSGRE